VATTLLATALVSLAHLLAMATRANQAARSVTVAVVLASEQLETLQSDPTDMGETGNRQDFFDARGLKVGVGETPPSSTAFVRRWSVAPLADDRLLRLEVLVIPTRAGAAEGSGLRAHEAETVRLVTLKRRRTG
jgi:hypothetical protein